MNHAGSAAAREPAAPRPPEAGVAVASPVPDTGLDDVLGDSGMSYDSRRKKLREHIDGPVTPAAGEELETFVRRTDTPEGLDRAQTDSLKSDALFALRKNDASTDRATELMPDLAADPGQGLVMREFALQHLARHHGDVPESEKPDIEPALRAVTRRPRDFIKPFASEGL